jgi:hypothetical protein
MALILACSLHFDDRLVAALIAKLSISNQFFVGNLATLDTYDNAHSVAEAGRFVDQIRANGGRAAVGYMAIPVEWGARFGRTTDELFDGCTNIAIGTAMLSGYDRLCRGEPIPRRGLRRHSRRSRRRWTSAERACVLRRYEIDLDIVGVPEHVLPDLAKQERGPRDPDLDPAPARSPVFVDDGAPTAAPARGRDRGQTAPPHAPSGPAAVSPPASAQR